MSNMNSNKNSLVAALATTAREHVEMAAESIIDAHRFADLTDRVLARFEDVDALFPSADELTAKGGDIVVIADALSAGLNPVEFGRAIKAGFELSEFAGLIERNNMEDVNSGLSHFADAAEEVALHPDVLDRIAALHGESVVALN